MRLAEAYDLVIFDLDGVIYLVDRPIPGAVAAVAELHRRGRAVAYATNNASRRGGDVAELLTGMGIGAVPAEVLTSAAVAAGTLASRLPAGARVLVVGADALRIEVAEAGLTPVSSADDEPVAVVQGYSPKVGWAELAEGCLAVRAGALWLATNTDRTFPTARGPLPGNGSLVAVLATALDRQPDLVVGKPAPELFVAAARRTGATAPLVVGDRLDTDIEGAVRAGMASLLVLTGVTGARELLDAPPERRPTYVAADLSGLFTVDASVPVPSPEPDRAGAGGWRVSELDGELLLAGDGGPVEALRALCRWAWRRGSGAGVRPGSDAAGAALRALGLIG